MWDGDGGVQLGVAKVSDGKVKGWLTFARRMETLLATACPVRMLVCPRLKGETRGTPWCAEDREMRGTLV